jgi:succinate dehydrogenase/fumarate reductase flavoprotein subunit
LAAASAGADVRLYEKGDLVGGTTALSGGTCWVPNNAHMAAAGYHDSRDDALAYLESLSHGLIDPLLAARLVDTGPEVVTWLEATTALRFQIVHGFPDYHPEHPGGKPGGGRSLDPGLFAYSELGAWAERVVRPVRNPYLTLVEAPLGGGDGQLEPAVLAERQRGDVRGCGSALVGGLLKALLDRGIEPVTGARASALVVDQGAVRGVRFDSGAVVDAGAVVLATGGFEWDTGLVRDFLRGPMDSPASVPTSTGDGLRMAMQVGASLGNMREAWWAPTIEIPGEMQLGRQRAHLILRERTLPRSIMVNRAGRRFANEAANYNALGGAFHQIDASRFGYPNLPCWLLVDQGHIDRYGFAGTTPGDAPAWLSRTDQLADLGRDVGIAPDQLVDTVAAWNVMVANGRDTDFGRGDSAYDHWCGDRQHLGTRAATLGPLDKAPFYAVEIHSGTLGTKGGPRTTADGEVLDVHDRPIPGLFAAGNVMAGVTGMAYGGAGGTLGPAISFGYLAGCAAAQCTIGATGDRP